MQTIARASFTTVKTEGGLLPADLLQRIADGRDLPGLRAEDYHLLPGERLNEAINRAWNRCLGAWLSFDAQRRTLSPTDTGTTLTRERWLLVLFQELGYGRLQVQRGGLSTPDGTSYPISHLWENTAPIHLVTFRQPLDKRSELATQVKRSPHSLMQEFLNRSPAYHWGIIANGLQLRLLRDNASLRRAAYVEFDLEAMMSGELYAEFSLLWLVCHQSRVERQAVGSREIGSGEIGEDDETDPTPDSLLPTPSTCWLETWSKLAVDQGTRALDALRNGVAEAIQVLGRGFLAHPANTELRRCLQAGDLTAQDYYQQLRRLVYRLIFLFVAEDRDLLLLPGADAATRQRYLDFYSLRRLRALAASLRGGPHADLYRQLRLLFVLLRQGYPALGLPGLGSTLFSDQATPDLDGLELANRDLLDALRALTFTVQNNVRRAVDYRNLDSEELGSVYESLLELHPQLNVAAATFTLAGRAGSERKTTGSYYTPTSLVESLLDSALEPVVAARLREVGSREVGRREIGRREIGRRREKDGGDTIVSGPAGVAGGDGSGRGVLPADTDLAPGGDVWFDQPDPASSDLDSGQYRGGVRSGGSQGVPPVSPHGPGFPEGAGDPSAHGGARRPGDGRDDDAAVDPMRRVGTDAPRLDPQARGREVGSGEVGSSDSGTRLPTAYSRLPTAEQAILSIKVLDYAAGSGHMLIGAGRRLARHLARIRTGDDEPTPDALRTALRDVVRHCLYGVDLNETAVELCKVALWMETLEPGKPLGFLDAHIRHGNSLVGVLHLDDLADGIPDEAYAAHSGDDRATAAALKKRNKQERERGQQASLFVGAPEEDLLTIWRKLLDAPEETVEQVAAKALRYADLRQPGGAWSHFQTACHLWTAPFFATYTGDKRTDSRIPTTRDLREYLAAPQRADPALMAYAQALAARHRFFHWSLEFPEVYGQGGFDVILSNPPWERIKLQKREWFAARHPGIANAPNAAARAKQIAALERDDPAVYADFMAAKHDAEKAGHFLRMSGRYPLCGTGDINTYAVFAELAYQMVRDRGRAGVIVPTGIATDDTTKFFFQAIMQTGSLASLYDFENRAAIFPGVDRRYKFCLLTLRGSREIGSRGGSLLPTPDSLLPAQFIFFALDVADLQDEERRFTLTAQEIALLNPNTRTCPIFRSKRDAELTKSIYRRVPVLIQEGPPEVNPWGVSFLRMFDMSNDSHRFRTRAQLEAEGYRLEGNRFVKGVGSREIGSSGGSLLPTPDSLLPSADVYLPLYEAKMFHHFDHRWATYEELDTRDVSLDEKRNPDFAVLPRYWIARKQLDDRLDRNRQQWFIAFRDVCCSTNERTAIFSIIPRTAVGHKAPLLQIEFEKEGVLAPLLASSTASIVFDFVCRQSIGGVTLSFFIVKQLSILPPNVYAQPCPWSAGTDHADWLLPRVLELTYTAWDLQPFAQDVLRAVGSREVGSSGGILLPTPDSLLPSPFRWDEERRFLLRCELDAAYFHLYGIARDDVAYMLETFPIVKRKDIAKHGEYRTQRVILEIYDEMAEAMRSGVPYQTRLDPPPADARVAHPPRVNLIRFSGRVDKRQ